MKKQNKNHIHQTKTAENSYSARTTNSRDSNNSRLDGRPAEQKMKKGQSIAKRRQVLEDNDRSVMSPQSFVAPAGPPHTLNIQEEMEKDTEEIFNKMDKIFEEYFGKMCPDFDPNCIQCKVNLVYNNFKKQIWDEFIKK